MTKKNEYSTVHVSVGTLVQKLKLLDQAESIIVLKSGERSEILLDDEQTAIVSALFKDEKPI